MRTKQVKYEAKFKKQHGISTGCYYYRLKHGIPLDDPKNKKGRRVSRGNPGQGKPADCLIQNGDGRPDRCFYCTLKKYVKCLNYAVDQNWKGWALCE